MKRIWKLAAWHWALARPIFFALCGAFGAQQLAVLLIAAGRPAAIGHSLATLYMACWQMPLFLLGLAGAFLAASAGLWRPGRARTGVTLCTLPGPRWHLPAAQSLLCGLLGLAFTAWQLLLYGVESPLVTAVLARTAAGRVTPALPAANLYAQAAVQPLLRYLAPAYPLGWAALAAGVLCVSVQAGCLFFHRGWGRVVSAALFLASCLGGLLTVRLVDQLHLQTPVNAGEAAAVTGGIALLLLALPLAVQWGWTLFRLRRGALL